MKLLWIFLVGLLVQAISSLLWVAGFSGAMSAFNSSQYVWTSKLFWTAQNILMFPAYTWTYVALPGGPARALTPPSDSTLLSALSYGILTPYPSIATWIWSFFLSSIFVMFAPMLLRAIRRPFTTQRHSASKAPEEY